MALTRRTGACALGVAWRYGFSILLSSCQLGNPKRADDLVSAERVRRKNPLSRELPGLNPQLDMLAPALPMLCRFLPTF